MRSGFIVEMSFPCRPVSVEKWNIANFVWPVNHSEGIVFEHCSMFRSMSSIEALV